MAKFNPFSEPDKFVLIIVIEVASYLIGQCKIVKRKWNDKFKLTKAKIESIIKDLKEMNK